MFHLCGSMQNVCHTRVERLKSLGRSNWKLREFCCQRNFYWASTKYYFYFFFCEFRACVHWGKNSLWMTKTIALSNSSIISTAVSETRFFHLNVFKNLPSCLINLVFRNGIAITAGIFTHKQAPTKESSTQALVSKRKKNLIGPSTKQMGQR